MTDDAFNFDDVAGEEAWRGGSPILGKGRHLVTVVSATIAEKDGEIRRTRDGDLQVAVQFANGEGEIREWYTLNAKAIGKFFQLTDAAKAPRPTGSPGPTELNGWLAQNVAGRNVAIWVTEEPTGDFLQDGVTPKTRSDVASVTPTDAGGEVPADTGGFAPVGGSGTTDDDIPF
jgi:hypothetical protein